LKRGFLALAPAWQIAAAVGRWRFLLLSALLATGLGLLQLRERALTEQVDEDHLPRQILAAGTDAGELALDVGCKLASQRILEGEVLVRITVGLVEQMRGNLIGALLVASQRLVDFLPHAVFGRHEREAIGALLGALGRLLLLDRRRAANFADLTRERRILFGKSATLLAKGCVLPLAARLLSLLAVVGTVVVCTVIAVLVAFRLWPFGLVAFRLWLVAGVLQIAEIERFVCPAALLVVRSIASGRQQVLLEHVGTPSRCLTGIQSTSALRAPSEKRRILYADVLKCQLGGKEMRRVELENLVWLAFVVLVLTVLLIVLLP
jgi:hypothetical protein